jgi:hypothetical protein
MKKIVLIIVLSVIVLSQTFAQGCSDAGVCTISNSHNNDSIYLKKNLVEVGYIFGKGLADVIYNNGYLAYNRTLKKNWELNSKLTYNQASGNFGTLGRLGDVFIVLNYTKKLNNYSSIKPSLGLKIPLSASNFKINDIALPLDYQASLGTLDALLSLEYIYKKWSFDAAFQIPIWQLNKNSYFDEYSNSNDFPSTNLFKRKSDVLIRSGYTLLTKDQKWLFKPNIMAIYHLGNDTYEDVFGERQTIKNSNGLTINVSFITEYNINTKNSLRLNIAAPLLVREIRPDGLTRVFVSSLSYRFKF